MSPRLGHSARDGSSREYSPTRRAPGPDDLGGAPQVFELVALHKIARRAGMELANLPDEPQRQVRVPGRQALAEADAPRFLPRLHLAAPRSSQSGFRVPQKGLWVPQKSGRRPVTSH